MPKLMARRRRLYKRATSSPVVGDTADPPQPPQPLPPDTGEFREIAKLHEPYLHIRALNLAGDKETAKDLVQETLARALFHFRRFRQGSNARAWLVTILTNLYYDYLKHEEVIRKAGAQLVTLEDIHSEVGPSQDATEPAVSPGWGVSDDALWKAVKALEPDLRAAVECCYVRGLRYKETADKLGVPIGTISTRLKRARERLRALLTEEG